MISRLVNLNGMPVRTSEHAIFPKMELSPDVMVSDVFRAKFDSWLMDFFGYTPGYCLMGNTIVIHPEALKLLQERIETDDKFTGLCVFKED